MERSIHHEIEANRAHRLTLCGRVRQTQHRLAHQAQRPRDTVLICDAGNRDVNRESECVGWERGKGRGRGGVSHAAELELANLLVALGQSEADLALGSRGWGDQLPQCLEDLIQLLVMLAELRFGLSLEILEAPLGCGVRGLGAL